MIRYRGKDQDNAATCIHALKEKGYRIVATSPRADSVTPESIPLDKPMAFCLGTELTGLSDTMMNNADTFLRIPMHGFTESYNISVSAAIVLYTVMQRLRASTDVDWRLKPAEVDALKLSWARKSVHSAKFIEEHFLHGGSDK
jgi:tRNA (guanosine-2'-O-)-methyltransferase